jgi:transposase
MRSLRSTLGIKIEFLKRKEVSDMLQRFKVRLFPDEKQEVLFWKSVGVARFAWNWGLAFQMKRFADGEKLLSASRWRSRT